jgi:hypothetical protein
MIDSFVRSILGTWGNIVLDFYLHNDLLINALVLFYAVLVFLGRTSYQRSAQFLTEWYLEKNGRETRSKTKNNLGKLIDNGKIPWASTVSAYWFPLITPPNRFVFFIKNERAVERIFRKEALVDILHAKDKKNG